MADPRPTSDLGPLTRAAMRALPATRDLPDFLDDRLGFLDARAASGEATPRLRLGWPTYLLTEPADVEHVLVANHRGYDKTRRLTGRRGRRLVGEALLTATGAEHRRRRHALQPLFHRRAVTEIVPAAAERAALEIEAWPETEAFDAIAAVRRLVLRLRLRTVFSDAGEAELDRLGTAVLARHRFLLHLFAAVQPLANVFPRELARGHREATRVIRASIEARTGERRDLISMLGDATEEGRPLSPQEVRDEVVTIALTGYETLVALLVWCLHVLACHPEVQRRVRAEVDALTGPALIADLDALPYLNATICETLRLYPPTWLIPRVSVARDRLPSGLELGPHTKLYVSQWIAHRDARRHPDPQRFDPERFAPGWRRRMQRGTYIPFGAGSHVCIAQRQASAEAALILAAIVMRWQVDPVGGLAATPDPGQTLMPREGLTLRLRQRDPLSKGLIELTAR